MAGLYGLLGGNILSSLKVTPEVMQSKASVVLKHVREMQIQFQNLENSVNRTKNYWIGEAGDAHRAYYSSRKEEIEEIFARLNEDVTDLQKMAAVYAQTEMETEEMAEALPSDVIV